MRKKVFQYFLAISLFSVFATVAFLSAAMLKSGSAVPDHAYAVTVGLCPDGTNNCSGKNYQWVCKTGENGCTSYLVEIYKFAKTLLGSLATLIVIWSGFIYLTSRGDSSKITLAKEWFVGAILGYILIFVIGIILDFIGSPGIT